jgi:CRP-like cAMP-binding protein
MPVFSGMSNRPKNRLLASIPDQEWARVRHEFEPIRLYRGDILVEPGAQFTHAFFPEDGIISTVTSFETGAVVEAAATGSEGMLSVKLALGAVTASNRKVVQVSGLAYQVSLETFERLCEKFPAFREMLLAYAQAYLGQILQLVACSGIHTIEERCARWLLMCHDRVGQNRLPLTQEFLAELLGVSRPAVNRVCRILQSSGAIQYSRGIVSIEDRGRLAAASCECYAAIRSQFDQLLPGSFAR